MTPYTNMYMHIHGLPFLTFTQVSQALPFRYRKIDFASSISTCPLALLSAKHLWWYNLGLFLLLENQLLDISLNYQLGLHSTRGLGRSGRQEYAKDTEELLASVLGMITYIYKTILHIAPIWHWALHHALTQM